MKLYHGSLEIIEKPKIIVSSLRTTDFGSGFYTTTDYGQAERWTKIRQKQDKIQGKVQAGFVSIYEVDDDLMQKTFLNCLVFPAATMEWLQFVVNNRKKESFEHRYDIVFGPVANDKVYTTLSLYEMEQLDAEETLRRLKTYTLVNQVLFHTEAALTELRYLESEPVK